VDDASPLDFEKIRTYPLASRRTRWGSRLADVTRRRAVAHPEFDELVERLAAARRAGGPILWSMGRTSSRRPGRM